MDAQQFQSLSITRRRFFKVAAGTGSLLLMPPTGLFAASDRRAGGKDLIVRQKTPLNAEPALGDLTHSWITPTKYFYVRTHAPVPEIDPARFRLSVEGLVHNPLTLSLAELKDLFETTTVTATMTCAGNRREEHSRIRQVGGVQWAAGAIGNARWGGIRLADLLERAGVQEGAKHVWFEGLDEIKKGGGTIPFGGSIPLEAVLNGPQSEPGPLVTDEMNGEPLLPEHGYPLRMVVPGYIGARSVKWLGKIVVSDRPSDNHYLTRAYKLIQEDAEPAWNAAEPIQKFPINAAICNPAPNAKLAPGPVRVQGYALCPGQPGRTIRRVEISTDGGNSWAKARLTGPSKPFCWNLWEAEVAVSSQTQELIVRAIDSAGEVQPPQVEWNYKGYLFNAWYRVPVRVG